MRVITRSKKLFLGTGISVLRQIVAIICGFILPRAILSKYGSEVNGLVSSITQFLGFITMAECGVSSVVQANLYGPLAQKDYVSVSKIFVSSEKFFRKIGYILAGYIVVLMAFYPRLVKGTFDFWFVSTLIFILAINSFAQYFFGMTYRILLNADQLSFIVSILQCASTILTTIISVVLINFDASIHTVKLVASIIFLLQPLCMGAYIKKNYSINRKIKYEGEPIKQKWNGFAQHVAQIVATNTDTVVLTIFSSLSNVSIYAVYNLVISGIVSLFDALNLGIAPFIGNMLAKNEMEKLDDFFSKFEWIWHTFTILIFTITGILIVPFVKVYTLNVNDANYIVPLFGAVITIAYAIRILRTPYHIIVSAAGHYKQTQMSSYIEAILNILISIIMVARYGLIGVAIGTIVAMTYRTFYLPFYLRNNILKRNISNFLKHILIDIISSVGMIITTKVVNKNVMTYNEWILLSLKVVCICVVVSGICNYIFYSKTMKACLKTFKRSR